MGNTIKTLSDGDIVRKALSILHNELVFTKNINKQYDNRFAVSGAKNGGTLLIRDPNQFTVRTGAVMDTQDITETTQTMTVAYQLGVDLNFTSVERTMSMDDMEERVLQPAMSRLAAEVDAYGISVCYPAVYQFENTTFGTKPVLADVLTARARLNQSLAPSSDRIAMVDSLAANAIITDSKLIFNPASEISRQYSRGLLGTVSGFQFLESEMTPTHTNGTRTDSTPITTISTIANGDTTLATTGATGTVTKGDVFTIADVYDVNPETKVALATLKQFAIRTAHTNTATDTYDITPTIYKSGAKQNCYCSSWAGSKALVFVAAGGSGPANTAYTNSLFYHKDAFTMASADLILPSGGLGSRAKMDNISMRIWQGSDIVNDKHPLRLDVLVGFKAVRPGWAVRVCS